MNEMLGTPADRAGAPRVDCYPAHAAFPKWGGVGVRIVTFEACSGYRGRDGHCWPPTGSPEAIARPRLPQNVACGFPAPRSSAVGSQLSLLSVQVSFPWSADLLSE